MPVKQQNSSENAASTWSLIRQATLCTTWAWGVVIWSQTCVYTQPLLYHNRLFQQSLTKWHQHSQRIHVTQNKHKATHDQLNQTASFGGVTFSASVVQLGKALVRLLFSSLFLAHENIDTHADKYTLVPHLSVTVSSVLWQKRLWGPLVFYIPVVIYNSAPLKKKKKEKNPPILLYLFQRSMFKWCPAICHYLVCSFLGVPCFLVCHRWLAMVMASTLADMVLAGIWLNCFLSELYLYRPSIILAVMLFGPMPASLVISSVSGQ